MAVETRASPAEKWRIFLPCSSLRLVELSWLGERFPAGPQLCFVRCSWHWSTHALSCSHLASKQTMLYSVWTQKTLSLDTKRLEL